MSDYQEYKAKIRERKLQRERAQNTEVGEETEETSFFNEANKQRRQAESEKIINDFVNFVNSAGKKIIVQDNDIPTYKNEIDTLRAEKSRLESESNVNKALVNAYKIEPTELENPIAKEVIHNYLSKTGIKDELEQNKKDLETLTNTYKKTLEEKDNKIEEQNATIKELHQLLAEYKSYFEKAKAMVDETETIKNKTLKDKQILQEELSNAEFAKELEKEKSRGDKLAVELDYQKAITQNIKKDYIINELKEENKTQKQEIKELEKKDSNNKQKQKLYATAIKKLRERVENNKSITEANMKVIQDREQELVSKENALQQEANDAFTSLNQQREYLQAYQEYLENMAANRDADQNEREYSIQERMELLQNLSAELDNREQRLKEIQESTLQREENVKAKLEELLTIRKNVKNNRPPDEETNSKIRKQ